MWKKRFRLRVAKLHFLPCSQRNLLESAFSREIQSSQNILCRSASEKHDPESRFLCQSKSSSRSIGSPAHCTAGVNWKSKSSAQPLSSNILPREDDFLDNKFSASVRSNYKSDCEAGSGWEDMIFKQL
ncbi:uncharacterized protein [Solanum lycopersicum]|uniref:Uncharacterized protein n=1 Tax=Solanum lycopersicum TaxID=4081 RepID=A0A3Q7FCF6_SOLLC